MTTKTKTTGSKVKCTTRVRKLVAGLGPVQKERIDMLVLPDGTALVASTITKVSSTHASKWNNPLVIVDHGNNKQYPQYVSLSCPTNAAADILRDNIIEVLSKLNFTMYTVPTGNAKVQAQLIANRNK